MEGEVGVSWTLDDVAWHRAMGQLIDGLHRPNFWPALVQTLGDLVPFDTWVALRFVADGPPQVFAECPTADGSEDRLFQDYLRGLYLLDPFYKACREEAQSGLLRLDDVAPDRFRNTEYYRRYFRLNVVEDEVQFNAPLAAQDTLCLSLGAARRFSPAEMAALSLVQPWVLGLMRQRCRLELAALAPEPAPPPRPGGHTAQSLAQAVGELKNVSLTTRELEVSRLMLGGHSSKGIAQRLTISIETVRAHKKHVYSKLGINSQAELFSIFLNAQQAG
jgi:DNA-binding CsgD family transcriptional regulator